MSDSSNVAVACQDDDFDLRSLPPASPCRALCRLNADKVCTGCGRSIQEIGSWRTMTIAQQHDCVDNAAKRLTAMSK